MKKIKKCIILTLILMLSLIYSTEVKATSVQNGFKAFNNANQRQ